MSAVPAVSLHEQATRVGFTPSTERRRSVLLATELRGLARLSDVLDPSLVMFLANEFFAWPPSEGTFQEALRQIGRAHV